VEARAEGQLTNIRGAVLVLVGLLAGCASAPPPRPPLPPSGSVPTACEKRAFMTGKAPDPDSRQTVADGLRWGLLAPESCADGGGRLDGSPLAR
jgi:hypothetical protein